MMFRGAALGILALCGTATMAIAQDCPGHPDALGTSRVIYVDPADHPKVGSIQYGETLPLADHEVVLTFDDGPSRTNTPPILDALRAECVKATFFIVGSMAHNAPALVKRAYDEGHSIGTHSQNHPLNLSHLAPATAWGEMENGIASVTKALGEGRTVAPFMRFPALDRTRALEQKAIARGIMIWSVDVYADDWMRISPQEVVRRPLERLEQAGKGIVLFHDIHARTVAALPEFLKGLKQRGFKIVHVVPLGAGQAKTETASADWHALDRSRLEPAKMRAPHQSN
jgi:peptidoglycan-N-acetylglucosamine deacetylase